MVQTSGGGYALAGIKDTADFWMVKTDSDGNVMWNKTYVGEVGTDQAFSVIQTSDGHACIGHWNFY